MNDELLFPQLNVRINGCPIQLGMELNRPLLAACRIEKANLLNRFLVKPRRDERLYMARDCSMAYLTGRESPQIIPVVGVRAPKETRFGTTCYFWFKQKKLIRFAFQIIYNQDLAAKMLSRFEEELNAYVGSPNFSDPTSRVWEEGDQGLIIEYPDQMKQGYVHLMYNDSPIFTHFKKGMRPGKIVARDVVKKKISPAPPTVNTWECSRCRRLLENSDDSCWSCGGNRAEVELK